MTQIPSIESKVSVFSKIIQGEIPADILFEDEFCIVIRDANPQAPLHLLVIPRKPIVSLLEATEDDLLLLGHLNLVAAKMAKHAGCENGFRLIANNGAQSGQTVFHLHYHVLGQSSLPEHDL
jgi:histidine triad (HIT) family protein